MGLLITTTLNQSFHKAIQALPSNWGSVSCPGTLQDWPNSNPAINGAPTPPTWAPSMYCWPFILIITIKIWWVRSAADNWLLNLHCSSFYQWWGKITKGGGWQCRTYSLVLIPFQLHTVMQRIKQNRCICLVRAMKWDATVSWATLWLLPLGFYFCSIAANIINFCNCSTWIRSSPPFPLSLSSATSTTDPVHISSWIN